MSTNPYQKEINEQKTELLEAFELAQSINSAYSVIQFLAVLESELKKINTRKNELYRSGQSSYIDDDLRISFFAYSQLIAQLKKELK